MRDSEFITAIRTPGAPVVIVNPPVENYVLDRAQEVLRSRGVNFAILDANDGEDRTLLEGLPAMHYHGAVIVRNFDLLPMTVQDAFAQHMKLAADECDMRMKVIAIGTEQTVNTIVGFASDICLRLRVLRPD